MLRRAGADPAPCRRGWRGPRWRSSASRPRCRSPTGRRAVVLPHPHHRTRGAFERARSRRQRDCRRRRIILEIGRFARRGRAAARPDSGFDPPHTTMSVGTITGGTAVNIIARECSLRLGFAQPAARRRGGAEIAHRPLYRDRPAAADARGLSAGGGRDRDHRRRAAAGAAAELAGRGTGRRLTGATRRPPSRSRPRPGCFSRPASRRWSAARARSRSRTSPTNTSPAPSSPPGRNFSIGCSTGDRG